MKKKDANFIYQRNAIIAFACLCVVGVLLRIFCMK